MKARGGRFLLILGAGLAAMAFVVTYLVMSRSSQSADQSAAVPDVPVMRSVVVAKKDIPAYTTLDETNLGLMEVEVSTIPANAVADPTLLYKKMSTGAIKANSPILESQASAVSFSNALAKGEKAFSLAVTARNTFGDSLTEGDRVDILWTVGMKVNVPYRTEDGKIKYEMDVYTSTKTLLQNIKVIRVTSLRPSLPPSGSTEGDAQKAAAANQQAQQSMASMYGDGAPNSAVLLLAVNDQQAEVLTYARDLNAKLDLTLRSSAAVKKADGTLEKDAAGNEIKGDHEIEKTTGVTLDELLKAYGIPPVPNGWGTAPTP